MEFTVHNPAGISVKQLGVIDHQGDGINGNIRVAIFNKTNQQIVPGLDAAITGLAASYSGNYRIKDIPLVTLTPGTYVLVTKGYSASKLNGNADFGTQVIAGDNGDGGISYTGNSLFGTADGFNYPNTRMQVL